MDHWGLQALPQPRAYAATASTDAGTYILGGIGSGPSSLASTSAFLPADSMAWEEGPDLPQDMNYPCAAGITPISFLLLHGKNILEFDSSEATWRPAGTWPDLLTYRSFWPGCAVLGRTLIIAGGYHHQSATPQQSTEALNLDTRVISYGPSMATPRLFFHLVAIHGPRLLAIGGSSSVTNLASVEELVDGAWVEAVPLEAGRGAYGALAVPEGLACA